MSRASRRLLVWRLLAATVAVAFATLLAELVLQSFVKYPLAQGRLVGMDPILGWKPLPHLNVTRRNAEGHPWNVTTGACGLRGACDFRAGAARRLLVLGDSFAFGEGVSIDARFDTVIARENPTWSIVNTGMMGYGTDQQLLASRPFVSQMAPGDAILLLVHGSDFYDILRNRFAARPKPWLEVRGGEIVEHPPSLGVLDALRERSYLASVVAAALEEDRFDYSDEETARAMALVERMLIKEAEAWDRRNFVVVAVWHGMDLVTDSRSEAFATRLAQTQERVCGRPAWRCAAIDSMIRPDDERYLLPDGHWNKAAHALVGRFLGELLETAVTSTVPRRTS